MNSFPQPAYYTFPDDTLLPPSPPLTPPGYDAYGPLWVADVLHVISLAVAAAVTACAVYVLVHFAWAALKAFPETREVDVADEAADEVAE